MYKINEVRGRKKELICILRPGAKYIHGDWYIYVTKDSIDLGPTWKGEYPPAYAYEAALKEHKHLVRTEGRPEPEDRLFTVCKYYGILEEQNEVPASNKDS